MTIKPHMTVTNGKVIGKVEKVEGDKVYLKGHIEPYPIQGFEVYEKMEDVIYKGLNNPKRLRALRSFGIFSTKSD